LLKRYLLLLTTGLLLVMLPATFGIAITAPELVDVLLKDEWRAAIVPLRLLSFYAALRCLDPLWTQLLTVTGHARFALRQNVLAAILLPLAFIVATRWGIVGVAAAWIVVHPLVIVFPLFAGVSRTHHVGLREQIVSIAPPAVSVAVMAVGVIALRHTALLDVSPLGRLLGSALAGAALYAATLFIFFRRTVRQVLTTLRRFRRTD
jgi:O-antigen/teichoic acid export membrane protein